MWASCYRIVSVIVLSLVLTWQGALGAVQCDQVDDNLPTGLSISTFMSAGTGTLMLWYRPIGAPLDHGPECWSGEDIFVVSENIHWMGLHRNNQFTAGTLAQFCAYNWDGNEDSFGVDYVADTWTHLAWVHDGGFLTLYKDGLFVNSVASGDTGTTTEPLSLCGGGGLGEPASGEVAEVAVYPVAIPASLIASLGASRLMRLGTLVPPSGYWSFDQCTHGTSAGGFPFPDASGNNRTITGTAGANTTGLDCLGSNFLSYAGGGE